MAARLCALAKGGQILIDETTRNRLPADIETAPFGQIDLRGLSQPHQVFEVI